MDNMDITTSHNIVVSVELATVLQRILATVIDGFLMGIFIMLLSVVSMGSETLVYVVGLPIMFLYHLFMEYFNNGQSVGKKLLKLKVVSLSGDRPSLMSLVMRWMFRLIDVTLSIGALGAIFISSTKKKQRIGDLLGDTSVIKLQNENHMNLNSIKSIMPDGYEVTYPGVTRYTDSDMLLVKDAISRMRRAGSEENKEIVQQLVHKISKDLKLRKVPQQGLTFLNTLLNDYIILTR